MNSQPTVPADAPTHMPAPVELPAPIPASPEAPAAPEVIPQPETQPVPETPAPPASEIPPSEPPVPSPAPEPTPIPPPAPEPIPEPPAQEPVPEPPQPDPAPVIAPTPTPEPTVTLPPESIAPAAPKPAEPVPEQPVITEAQPTPSVVSQTTESVTPAIPPAVLALSDTELKIAAAYYLQKNQQAIARKGVEARQKRMHDNMAAIQAYLKTNGSSQIPRISRALNLSPGLTSHYLQILVKQHKVKADGWAKKRRYSL